MAKQKKLRPLTPEDLYRFETPSGCAIAPDGNCVLFALQRTDKKSEKRFSNLWIAPATRERPRPFTYGDHTDRAPAFSPDGACVAFLSNRANAKQEQLYVIRTDGGEARPLTQLEGAFGGFRWSPDSKRLLLQFRKQDAAARERERTEESKKRGVVCRHITKTFYKLDEAGYLPEERFHIWVVDAKTGKAAQLTSSDRDERSPCWSPDGTKIAFIKNTAPDPDLEPDADEIFVISSRVQKKRARPRLITTPFGGKGALGWSPTGEVLSYLGHEGRVLFATGFDHDAIADSVALRASRSERPREQHGNQKQQQAAPGCDGWPALTHEDDRAPPPCPSLCQPNRSLMPRSASQRVVRFRVVLYAYSRISRRAAKLVGLCIKRIASLESGSMTMTSDSE